MQVKHQDTQREMSCCPCFFLCFIPSQYAFVFCPTFEILGSTPWIYSLPSPCPFHSPQPLPNDAFKSNATITCRSRVLKPLAIYHWIVAPATWQHTTTTRIYRHHTVPVRFIFPVSFFKKELKSIPLANCCKHCIQVQGGLLMCVSLNVSLLSSQTSLLFSSCNMISLPMKKHD